MNNLPPAVMDAANWMLRHKPKPNTGLREVQRMSAINYNNFNMLRKRTGRSSWVDLLEWNLRGGLEAWLNDEQDPDTMPDRDMVLTLPAQKQCNRTRISLRGSCCAKCGAESQLLKRGGKVLCAGCAGVRQRARITWSWETGQEIDQREQKTRLDPLYGLPERRRTG